MRTIALFEIALIIMASIAISHLVGKSEDSFAIASESEFIKKSRALVLGLLDDNLVSAEEVLWTCLENNQGSFCQEYPSSTCNSNCNSSCFPGRRESYSECALGTCIDSSEGTCSPRTPKRLCEGQGGTWRNQDTSEIVECRRGCCLLGSEAQFVTESSCNILQNRLGVQGEFRPAANELQCLSLARSEVEGACVFVNSEERSCKLIKKISCIEQGGEFHEGLLCSNPELETTCLKQSTIGCFPGLDEVYWIDSCGNRENIYDANRERSWNLGRILGKQDSCELGLGGNPLFHQSTCGNCNYLLGSVCGTPEIGDARPVDGNAVCRDLSCRDENGQTRKHGESWCAFESQIGVEGTGNNQRSVDLPGSSHYRKVCFEGEIRVEPCGDFRNEVCVENRNEEAQFSQAACRINQWQKCFEANTDKTKLAQCEQTTDCALKTVNLGDKFKFDRCVPRYPPGFDLNAEAGGDVGESLCALGSQKCTVFYEKKLFGGWKCIANCDCRKPKFTESMNNLCISLGDCGGNVNIEGDFSGAGYSVRKAPKLGNNYIAGLKALATPKSGQKVLPLTPREIAQLLNLDPSSPQSEQNQAIANFLGYVGLGGTGVVLAAFAYQTGVSGLSALLSGDLAFGFGPVATSGASVTTMGAFVSGLAGAAVGAAIGYILGKALGVQGEGLIATTIAGAVGGGLAAAGVLPTFGYMLNLFVVAVWAIVFAAVVIAIIKLLGIGDTKKVTVNFQCKPWQPPTGGEKCGQCGKNGLPCNKYQCQSLGQLCELVNEGTSEEACINTSPNDVLAPVIRPNPSVLLQGQSYTNVVDNGYRLQGQGAEGCLPAYTQIRFGIALNERAACKIDTVRTSDFDSMEFDFGGSGLYRLNHTQSFFLPSLDAAGRAQQDGPVSDEDNANDPVININPNQRNDFRFYVRCEDRSGNHNLNEYAIDFCIDPAPDRTAPVINRFSPTSPGYTSINQNTLNLTFFVNEPAECRWSTRDESYDSMINQAGCNVDLEDIETDGFRCNTLLSVSDNSTYYFRCNDQPWLVGNETSGGQPLSRNSNAQSFRYEVRRTTVPLKIESVSPNNGTITSGGLPIVVDLEVKTSGGAPNTARYCEFDAGGGFVRFFESSGNVHRQPGLNFIEQREYTIPILCKDDAGNEATATSRFRTLLDDQGPRITRTYQQNGLVIITNEPATCAYNLNSCLFNFNEGTLLSGTEYIHSMSFNRTSVHHIVCRDRYNNPGNCLSVSGSIF